MCAKSLSHVWLWDVWTVAHKALLSRDFPVGNYSLLQGIVPTQGSNPDLPHCRWILHHLSHQGSLRTLEWVAILFYRESYWPTDGARVSHLQHWWVGSLQPGPPGKSSWMWQILFKEDCKKFLLPWCKQTCLNYWRGKNRPPEGEAMCSISTHTFPKIQGGFLGCSTRKVLLCSKLNAN